MQIPYLIPLWKHQIQAVEMSKYTPDLALFFEMGTGKTATTINILRHRYAENKRLMRTLVLGPPIVIENWRREFQMHSKISSYDVVPLVGTGKKRIKTFTEAALDHKTMTLTRPRIFITNYEGIHGKPGSDLDQLHTLLLQWQPEILVCDESHRLKNHQSKRAKNVVALADLAKHKYLLTGTPILNTPMDIFHQYRILDRGETFGENFYSFRAVYFEDENAGWSNRPGHFPKYTARAETYNILNEKIYRKALRVLKKDCLDLPPLVRKKVFVELGEDQARMYAEMREEYITYVQDLEKNSDQPRAVVAQMALTKALRLQQIVSGYAKTDDGQEIPIKDNPRLEALGDLLEELTPGHKVIIWATFHENYRQIAEVCKERKINYVELHGGVPSAERTKAQDTFRNDQSCRVIIANQGAAGIGINLVEASYSIFFSRNFSLEQDLQAEARNYRGGSEQHEKITRIDLVSPGTIDELILEALANKQSIAEQVLSWREKL